MSNLLTRRYFYAPLFSSGQGWGLCIKNNKVYLDVITERSLSVFITYTLQNTNDIQNIYEHFIVFQSVCEIMVKSFLVNI